MKGVTTDKENMNISFIRSLSYLYIPTFIFLFSRAFFKNIDIVFTGLFLTVITISSFSSYYLVNKGFDNISSNTLIIKVIPLTLIISITLGILLNILV